LASLSLSPRDWNSEYQAIIERVMAHGSAGSLDDMRLLRDLAADFYAAAQTYARIIIAERHVPVGMKVIRPVGLGGVAGGEKYVVHGILFKFALDQRLPCGQQQWMYGGAAANDANAMRAAAHELKGVTALGKCHVDGLCLPLMCLIDFLGFRLVAMSILPIQRHTIVYGSCDGSSIHADDEQVNQMMASVARKLNLAPHLVADRVLHVAGDVEAHRGADERAYVIDLARLFPPEAPDDGAAGQRDARAVFHQLLRPELVRQARQPLSSDAFTNFQRYDKRAAELNDAVREASVQLVVDVVPRVAALLCQRVREAMAAAALSPGAAAAAATAVPASSSTTSIRRHVRRVSDMRASDFGSGELSSTSDSLRSPPLSPAPHGGVSGEAAHDDERPHAALLTGETVVEVLHKHGVNLRHLGRVRRAVDGAESESAAAAAVVRKVLLSEMCSRVLKKRLELGWRRLATTALSIQPHRRLVLSELNRVFGPTSEASAHWRDFAVGSLKFELHRKFAECLATPELLASYDLRQSVDVPQMFWRLQRITGITMSMRARRELSTAASFTFVEPDVEQLHVTGKHSNLIEHVSGVVLAMQAAAMSAADPSFDRLYSESVASFRKALLLVPDDVSTHYQLARLIHVRAKLVSDVELFDEARAKYLAALQFDAEFAPAQHALALLDVDRLAVRAIEWRTRAVMYAAASEPSQQQRAELQQNDVRRRSFRVVPFPMSIADVERLLDSCTERARLAIASASRGAGLRRETRAAVGAFLAMEPSLRPQTTDQYLRPLMRRVAADVSLGIGAALLSALVGAPDAADGSSGGGGGGGRRLGSSSTEDSEVARIAAHDADARHLSVVCCRWALAYLCTADLAVSTALQLIEHAGRRLQTAASADPTHLLAWLGPMVHDDATLIAFAHISQTSCALLQEPVRERLRYVEELYVDRCVALPASLLASSVAQCARLKVLSLRGCFQVNDEMLATLVRALAPTLRIVDLSQCVTLTADAMVTLANTLPQLRGLALDRCDLVDNTSIRQLAMRCPSLQYLSLARTRGSPSLVDHAIEALVCLPDLLFLSLDHHHQVTDAAVCSVLRACRRLRCLRLDGCLRVTSRAVLNTIGRRPSSFALALDAFRDSMGASSPTAGGGLGSGGGSGSVGASGGGGGGGGSGSGVAGGGGAHGLRFVSLVGHGKNVPTRHVRQFNELAVDVRIEGSQFRPYSDENATVEMQRTMMAFFVKAGLYAAQRPVLPTSAAVTNNSAGVVRLPAVPLLFDDDDNLVDDAPAPHATSPSSSGRIVSPTLDRRAAVALTDSASPWLHAADVEENAEVGLSGSLAALEADFERSFSGELHSSGSTGAPSAGASAANKPKRMVPSRFLHSAKREHDDLQQAVKESLEAEHAAQVAMLNSADSLRRGVGGLQFDDDDDDDDDGGYAYDDVEDEDDDDALDADTND
jgi:uncharacterized membrane protein YgcG